MTLADFPKLERDGKVAVVYHESYGSPWAGCRDQDLQPILCMHRDIAQAVVDGSGHAAEIARRIITEFGFNPDLFWLADDGRLEIAWVPKGSLFRIDECDGSEQVIVGTDDMMTV